MSRTTCQISISLDGYVAGPNQSTDNPIGEGGMRLHEWAFATSTWREQHGQAGGERNADAEVAAELMQGIGAYIMGRRMFGGGDGAWDASWTGWWGDDPPYHTPVYVLTHEPREPLQLQGGTTFHFVTDGIEPALDAAQAVAGDLDVSIAGGASTVNQYLAARAARRAAPARRAGDPRVGRAAARGRRRPDARADLGRAVTGGEHVKYRVVH